MKIRVLLGAWLLAIASGAAYALGLGEIIVNSRLNQPLDAEILVREAVPGEAEQLVAKLASQEDFARVGLERSRMPVMLRFETGTNARGQTVIKVISDEPVREPFLTLLVEANWSGGRLLREYGLLLDPPVSAPASTIARSAPPQTTPVQPAVPASTLPRPAAAPAQTSPLVGESVSPPPAPAAPPPPPPAPPVPATRAATPPPAAVRSAPAPAPRASSSPPPGFAQPAQPVARPVAPAPTPTPAPVASASPDGGYTVQRGDTLYGIAREFASDAGVSPDQMMVALQRGNTGAFFGDNINNLKAGVVLRIPDADAAGSLSRSDATAEVRRQNETWSSPIAVPSLADAGAAPARTVVPAPPPAADARLELVPPAGDSASDNATAGSAGNEQGGSDVAEVQAELQRTREDLRSRDQEVSELGSRVRDLEELNAKNARLLELKNAEVAELQRRLADSSTAAATPDATAAEPQDLVTDDASSASTAAVVPPQDNAAATDATPSVETGTASDETAVEADAIAADDPATPSVDGDAISSVGNESQAAAGTPPDTAAEPTAAGEELSEAEWEASATSPDSDPFADTRDGTPAAADSWTPGEPDVDPATATADDTVAPAATAAAPVEAVPAAGQPWYMQPMVQGAGLIGLALLLLLVLLARRQRKPTPDVDAPKRSVSDLFVDDGPVAAGGIGMAGLAASDGIESEDAIALQAQIARDPDDFGAYLELLSLYYAEGDRARFEIWAEHFYDRPGSEDSMEWEQVDGMGEELLPDHPLFGGEDDLENDVLVDEESQVARPTWTDEPMTPIGSRFDESGRDGDEIIQQPSTPTADTTSLRADATRRVYDIGGTDFGLDVGNDDLRDDDDSARPIEFSLDDLDTTAPVHKAPASRVDDGDDGDEVLPPLVFGDDMGPASTYRDDTPAGRGFETVDIDADGDREDDGGMDDAATKLELARAYLDMGDPDGARAMLEEVLGEGDTSQRDEARKLLATL